MLKNLLYKFYIGILLGLGIFILNPIKGYCASDNFGVGGSQANFTITTNNYVNLPISAFNCPVNGPYNQYGRINYSNFDINLNFTLSLGNISFNNCHFSSFSIVDCYVLFIGIDGGSYQKFIGSICLNHIFDNSVNSSFFYNFNSSVEGIPTGIRIVPNAGSYRIYCYGNDYDISSGETITQSDTYTGTAYYQCMVSFQNFSFDENSSSSSSSTIINNVTSNLTPIGFNALNFGVNGDCHFLGNNYTFSPSYLSPLILIQDFYNSPSGAISSAPMTLFMNQGANTSGNPISVIGDTRTGEYEFTLGFCLGSPISQSILDSLTTLSNWGFEFARGYSGENFTLPSDTRVSYTYFLDNDKQLYYLNIFFYFTTPNFFDCFIIRSAPTISNIRIGAFSFNKYTGTIADQITQSTEHWEDVPSSHQDFADANSTAASTVSSMADIEDETFSRVDDNISITGVDDFNLTVMATPMTTVSGLINQVYNVFPDELKYLIIAVLSIGIFAVIIRAGAYANGSNGGGD